jgi:hypothetical protein
MKDVYDTVYNDDRNLGEAKTAALSPEQRAERFNRVEYIRRVQAEAKVRYAGLPRTERRKKIREAVIRAQQHCGMTR